MDDNSVTLASNGQSVYAVTSFTFAKTGSASLSLVWIDTYFAPTDATCAQASIGNVTRPSSNTITIDGTGQYGAITADKVIATYARPFLNLPEGTGVGTITVNNLTFGSSYNQGGTDKFLASITGNTLTFGGNSSALDAAGYPTTFGTPTASAILIKQ